MSPGELSAKFPQKTHLVLINVPALPFLVEARMAAPILDKLVADVDVLPLDLVLLRLRCLKRLKQLAGVSRLARARRAVGESQ